MVLGSLALGFLLLVLGGEGLVRGAVALAGRLGVSPLLIGLTVVGFGTSTPELVTSLQAAFAGAPGIAIGNVVGSNIANALLILGVAALLSPLVVAREAFVRDGVALVLATSVAALAILGGFLGRPIGAALLSGLVLYIVVAYRVERKRTAEQRSVPDDDDAEPRGSLLRDLAWTFGGITLTIIGARYLVSSAISLAEDMGVSESLIGLTIVAVGTSLPELVTSVVAAIRRQGDVAFGNVVGSNLYNLLGILGVTALVRPIAVPIDFTGADVAILLASTAALVWVAATSWRITRLEGFVLLAGYAGYIAWLVMR